VGQVVDSGADLMKQRAVTKTEFPQPAGEKLTRVVPEGQHSCCMVKITTALTTLHKLANLPHLPIATNPVDRRNQILLTSQSPGETTLEIPLVHQYQDWTLME
jgi:hypothetical protein